MEAKGEKIKHRKFCLLKKLFGQLKISISLKFSIRNLFSFYQRKLMRHF